MTNQQNSVRDVVQSQIQNILEAFQQVRHNNERAYTAYISHYDIFAGKIYRIIISFPKTRVASIELNGYQSPKFQINMGAPQGSVSSALLSIIFLNDFLSNQAQKLKFADDSSVIVTGKDSSDSFAIFQKICTDIEWCADWRMLVNGAKTELGLFN